MVYALGRRGAGRLRRDLDLPFSRMEWRGKHKTVGRLFLDHALLVSEVMVTLELACRRRGDVKLLSIEDSAGRQLSGTSLNRPTYRWNVKTRGGRRLGVIPDKVFAVEQSDAPPGQKRTYFFLEADRATMPVTRRNPNQTSLSRKMEAYVATWKQDIHRTELGIARFRVLTVTTSSERSRSLKAACERFKEGRGLFVCLAKETLSSSLDTLFQN